MDRSEYMQAWSRNHGGARLAAAVRIWLTLAHFVAWPLVRLRISADWVTAAAVAIALMAPWLASMGRVAVAACLIAISGLLDSLDGAVAVMSGGGSRWGAMLDALGDRISDAAFVATLWVVGAPAWIAFIALALAWLHEYARARAGGLGIDDVLLLTVAERPTRVIVCVMFLVAGAVHSGWPWGALGATVLGVVGLFGFIQYMHALRSALTSSH
jgi:phosphatidylglycerophosphate synthase